MRKSLRTFLHYTLKTISMVISVLSIPAIRNLLWGKMTRKAKDKIVDIDAKVVKKD